MVKSHGIAPPVKDFTESDEGNHTHFSGSESSSANNDHSSDLRVSEGNGTDCVDSAMVRCNARQMSVDDTSKPDSDASSTWFLEEPDDINKQTSYPDRGDISRLVLQQISEESSSDLQNEQKVSITESEKDDDIVPSTASFIHSEKAQLIHSCNSEAPVKCEIDDDTKTDEYDEVDAQIKVRIDDSNEEQKLQNESNDWLPKFTIMDVTFAIFGVFLFLFDIITDWRLAIIYYFSEQMDMFYLTLGCILGPAIISGIISLTWSCIDYEYMRDKQDLVLLVLKVVFSILQLGRCFRNIVYIYYVIKSWTSPYHVREIKKKALEHKHDSAVLGLVDGFLESVLQLLLQLYLSLSRQIYMDFARIVSICLSWLSAALLHTSYYRNNRKVQKSKTNVGYFGALMYLCWRICELGPRFLLIALFIYTVPFWISVSLASFHFIFMLIFYIVQKPTLKGICCSDMSGYPFLLLISYIATFCYVNMTNQRTRTWAAVYYVLFYLENIGMFITVLLIFPNTNSYYNAWKNSSYMIIPGLVFHLLFQTLYYKFFHPSRSTYPGGGSDKTNCFYRIRAYFKKQECCGIPLM